MQSPDSDSEVSCVSQLLQIYGLTVSTLSQCKNANNGPAPVQKLDRHRSDPVLDLPGPGPVTEPVRSLVEAMKRNYSKDFVWILENLFLVTG